MSDELILLGKAEENEHIAIFTFNRPDAGNALNTPMLMEMAGKLDQVDKDESIRVMIMRSTGRHASFGADLNELVKETNGNYSNISKEEAEKHINDGRVVADKLYNLRVPTIGLIHGYCLGGGAEFYTLCDVLYGASGGKDEGGMMYGFPEPTIGVMAGWMGPEILIKKIGAGNAKDLLFTGRSINGETALNMGILQSLFPKDELMPKALEWATMVAGNAPLAVESTRRTINRVLFPHFKDEVDTSGFETMNNILTEDFIKGATKILTKSKDNPEYERK